MTRKLPTVLLVCFGCARVLFIFAVYIWGFPIVGESKAQSFPQKKKNVLDDSGVSHF
jgi:hypothetical protein